MNSLLPKIFPHLLLFTTYILLPTLFIPCLKLRGGQTEDELTDRTHTHIVSFIVLDRYKPEPELLCEAKTTYLMPTDRTNAPGFPSFSAVYRVSKIQL